MGTIAMETSGPSGGVFWHLRCLRSRARWQATARALADWLAGVQPASRHLLLVGPSAGWMLPAAFLLRFECIDAFDLDPLAGWLFERNHGPRLAARGVRWRFHRRDALAGLPDLLAAHPEASVMFDNLLGQQRFRLPDPLAAEAQMHELRAALETRDWGSVHDIYSGPVGPVTPTVAGATGASGGAVQVLPAVAVAGGVSLDGQDALSSQTVLLDRIGATGEWLDHLASGVFPPGTPCRLIPWPFSPGYAHWLQAAWVAGRGQDAPTSRIA